MNFYDDFFVLAASIKKAWSMELSWEIDDKHPRMHIKRMDGTYCRIKGDIIFL